MPHEGIAQGYYSYTYDDSSNNLKTVSRKLPGETVYTLLEEYSYYDLGQLKVVNYLQSHKRHYYTYDSGGNLSSENIYDITDYNNPVLENTITYTYGDNTWGDLLTNYNGSTISYDNIGNPTSCRNGISLTWQNGRQLQRYAKGSDVITYTYGAGGMRLSKTVNGTTYTYLYNGDQLVQETIGDRILDFSYDASGTVYAVRVKENANDEGTYYYYSHNTRGDVTALYTAGGNLYVKYTYDVWGNTVSVVNSANQTVPETSNNISIVQPFRYRGYCFDRETGWYYLQSRYYDPVTHRFLNADDEIVGYYMLGYNMFAYCFNNPINMIDPNGHLPKFLSKVINTALQALSYIKSVLTATWSFAKIGVASVAALVSKQATIDDLKQDFQNFSLFNNDANKVIESKVFSFYKGTPVIRHSFKGLSSLTIDNTIFLKSTHDIETLNHEWGHIIQGAIMTPDRYIRKIMIPSTICCIIDPDSKTYYSLPWDKSADMFGGVNRSTGYYKGSGVVSILYLFLP